MIEGWAGARNQDRPVNDDVLATVQQSVVVGDPGEGMRAIDVRVWGGVDLRILPDRGLDIGQAWYRGVPLAWISRVGETAPLDRLEGFNWSKGFGGGLMVTCGLRNVGMPSEGHGLHGTYSHLPARDVTVERVVANDRVSIVVGGLVTDPADPAPLRVERRIQCHAGIGRVEINDRTTNIGSVPAETPLLYHFNFGYPLWASGARLDIPVTRTIPRDEASEANLDAWYAPLPVMETDERVLEHVVETVDGWGRTQITNDELGIGVAIGWRATELPRLHQWIDPNPGMAVLGIEPANCSTSGRAHDRAEGRLPFLEPGETRETSLVFEAWSL